MKQGPVVYVELLQAVFCLGEQHRFVVKLTASSTVEGSDTYLKQKKTVTDKGQQNTSYALQTKH
jgi:hypothetical protein